MYKSYILPLAKQDIQEAALWYNNKQKGLGKEFTQKIRLRVRSICKHPRASAIRYDNTRTAILDVFPYMIHYTVDEAQKAIIISAVFHTSLNPGRWKNRERS